MNNLKYRAYLNNEMRYDVTGFEHGHDNQMTGVFIDGDFYHVAGVDDDRVKLYDKAIVMQWSGLIDSNGNDVYTGDIIQFPGCKSTAEVIFKKGMFCIDSQCKPMREVDDLHRQLSTDEFGGRAVVVGNTYENESLLEKTK